MQTRRGDDEWSANSKISCFWCWLEEKDKSQRELHTCRRQSQLKSRRVAGTQHLSDSLTIILRHEQVDGLFYKERSFDESSKEKGPVNCWWRARAERRAHERTERDFQSTGMVNEKQKTGQNKTALIESRDEETKEPNPIRLPQVNHESSVKNVL